MADFKHGEMNVDVQQRTFSGFVKTVGWAVVVILGILILAAIVNG